MTEGKEKNIMNQRAVHVMPSVRTITTVLGLCVFLGASAPLVVSGASTEQDRLVEKAKMTLEAFTEDPDLKEAIRHWKYTKGLFIVPELVRGAFIFGGAGGTGVLIERDERTGQWSQPAFYNIGAVSFGLQAGVDTSELVFVITSQRGLEQFYTTDFKLGADAALSVGPVGTGGSFEGVTADIISYGRSKGAFAGIAMNGALVAPSDLSNEMYYQQPVRPVDILVKGAVRSSKSVPLTMAANTLTNNNPR